MLYLLGGASRAGKSYLAREMLRRAGVPYFPIDALMMGFANGVPRFGIVPEDSGQARGERLWPLLRAMAVNLLEEEATHPTYLLGGDELLPARAAELIRDYPGQVRACFIGYADVDPAAKLVDVRCGHATWMEWAGEEAALAAIVEAVEFSRYVESECAAHGIPYFDLSQSKEAGAAQALAYLLGPPTVSPVESSSQAVSCR